MAIPFLKSALVGFKEAITIKYMGKSIITASRRNKILTTNRIIVFFIFNPPNRRL